PSRTSLRCLHSFPTRRSSDLLGGDAAAEGLDGHDGDDGDQGEEQAVLDHAGTGLVVGVELGLEPGLQNEKVHLISPLVGARGAGDRKSTRLNSSHGSISYAVF